MPCRVDMAGKEGDEENEKPTGRPPGGRALIWITPIKELNLEDILPIFVDGLREKSEPLIFMAERGVQEIIAKTSVKKMIKGIRSIVYPLKDNLRTLDDEICVKTIKMCQQICLKSDKLAEAFVPHFHIILPMFEVVQNKHNPSFGLPFSNKKPLSRAQERNMKLVELKKYN